LSKGEFLIKEGDVERNLYYIESGSVRAFLVSEFEEHTIRFGYEGSIINSLSSFIKGTPSEFYIDALRKTTIRSLSKENVYKLVHQNEETMQQYITLLEENGDEETVSAVNNEFISRGHSLKPAGAAKPAAAPAAAPKAAPPKPAPVAKAPEPEPEPEIEISADLEVEEEVSLDLDAEPTEVEVELEATAPVEEIVPEVAPEPEAELSFEEEPSEIKLGGEEEQAPQPFYGVEAESEVACDRMGSQDRSAFRRAG